MEMNQSFSAQTLVKGKIQRDLIFLAAMFSAAILLNCSENKKPGSATESPNIPAQEIIASTGSQNWTRYLSYSRPPSATVIIEACENEVDFPEIITPALEKVVDNGYRSESEYNYMPWRGGYGYYSGLDGGIFANQPGEEMGDTSSKQSNPPERAVVEPDIYALEDNILYTLNTYRGLQTVKTASLDNPQYGSGVYIPGFPNELYLKGKLVISTVAGFLPGSGWGSGSATELDPEEPLSSSLGQYLDSKIVVLDVQNPEQIALVSEHPLPGTLIESRIVGDIIYTVTFTPESIIVSSFNLAGAPEIEPVDQEIISFPSNWDWNLLAYTHLYVSPQFIYISVPISVDEGYLYSENTEIHCLDISDAGGGISPRGNLGIPGHVSDRFKLDLYKQTFRVISADWRSNNYLNIFDVSNPDLPNLLSTKAIGTFESLFASRFDGDRAYIVTFLRKDPLWILDLSNPENPMIVGELTVPGWSQYIEPLGDRLIALGVDDEGGGRRASVSLFSVEDPTNPRLLDKVTVGSEYSTSYGYADYKAFQVLPDENLIMLPWSDYQGFWWREYRMEDQVTLIDLLRDELKERGSLAHIGTVERPFLSRQSAFILSQSALQIANIDDRDQPRTLSLLRLLRSAKRIVPAGKYALVEDENNWWEVIRLNHVGFPSTARIQVPGTAVNLFPDGDDLFIVRTTEADENQSSRTEIHRLIINENGRPEVKGCFAFPSDFQMYPQTPIPLGDSSFGLFGSVSQWSGSYGDDVIIMNIAQADWYYKEGVLIVQTSDSGKIEPASFIESQSSSGSQDYYGLSYYYSYFPVEPQVRGHHLYLSNSATSYEENIYPNPGTFTAIYYAERLDLEDPAHPSLLLVNIPGELAFVSEDEKKFYYRKTDADYSSAEMYILIKYSLGACRYDDQGFQAGEEIELTGYPDIAFDGDYALLLAGTPYYWYVGGESGSSPAQVLSLLKMDDISDLRTVDTLELPEVQAGYSLNGFAFGRAFVSLGPFADPKRIREVAVSQGSWSASNDEMYAYLDLIYQVNDSRLEFEHLHPSTNWNPVPMRSENQVLVPAGMYGIEVLR